MRRTILSVFALLIVAPVFAQDIYKWTDEKGQLHFSQTPPSTSMKPALKDATLPTQLRSDEPCVPFKVGEPRAAKAYTPSIDFPHLELKESQVVLFESSPSRAVFSWKATVTNNSPEREAVAATVSFSDCSGFQLSEKKYDPKPILPGQSITFSGEQIIVGKASAEARRFHLGVGALRQTTAPAAVQPQPIVLLDQQPRLSVTWSRLREIDSQVILYGEVYNAGTATARSVSVLYTVKTKEGVTLVSGRVDPLPADLQPGQTTSFRTRIVAINQLSGQQAFLDLSYSK